MVEIKHKATNLEQEDIIKVTSNEVLIKFVSQHTALASIR